MNCSFATLGVYKIFAKNRADSVQSQGLIKGMEGWILAAKSCVIPSALNSTGQEALDRALGAYIWKQHVSKLL